MTFNSNADVSGSGAKRRGPGGGVIAGGVGGLGAIAVILLQIFTGGDFSSLLGGGGGLQAGPGTESEIQNCETGADANASVDCRLAAGSKVINSYWATQVQGYRQPQLIIVDGSTPTSCGTASNATGPFYCPPEETVYIDPYHPGVRDEVVVYTRSAFYRTTSKQAKGCMALEVPQAISQQPDQEQ